MNDAPDEPRSEGGSERPAREDVRDGPSDADGASDADAAVGETGDDELEELRRQVDEKYDFEEFGPADMAEMTVEEWEVAFDPETWITGEELLDRVEDDLAARVASREVFARIERHDDPPGLVAYSDEGYAVVYPDGSVTGEGTVLRDVKPSVALSSMESYEVPEPPADASLPEPEEVPEQSGELGNLMLQVVAGIQLVAALILLGAGAFTVAYGQRSSNAWLLFAAGIAFLIVGILLFFTVANARLSDAFRAEEYRNRLRAIGSSDDGRPDFLPSEPTAEKDPGTHPVTELSEQRAPADADEPSDDGRDSAADSSASVTDPTGENGDAANR